MNLGLDHNDWMYDLIMVTEYMIIVVTEYTMSWWLSVWLHLSEWVYLTPPQWVCDWLHHHLITMTEHKTLSQWLDMSTRLAPESGFIFPQIPKFLFRFVMWHFWVIETTSALVLYLCLPTSHNSYQFLPESVRKVSSVEDPPFVFEVCLCQLWCNLPVCSNNTNQTFALGLCNANLLITLITPTVSDYTQTVVATQSSLSLSLSLSLPPDLGSCKQCINFHKQTLTCSILYKLSDWLY